MNAILNKTVQSTFDGSAQEAVAYALGQSIGHALDQDFAVLTKAKADYEGGPFVVLFNLNKHLKPEQWKAMPDHEAETGNNPRFYKTRKTKADGKEKLTDRDFYKVVAESLPDVIAKEARIEMLGRSMKDATKFNLSDVPQDIKDMPAHRRHAEIAKLQRGITTARNNTIAALELNSQMTRAGGLQGVDMDVLYALDDKGNEFDGKDGRPQKIDETRAPIILTTKLERRKLVDNGRYSVSSFMRFNIPAAIEQGGSWDALLATVKKGTKEKGKNAVSTARNVETVETALTVQNDYAEYLNRIQAEKDNAKWQAFNNALHGPGSDDPFLNAYLIYKALEMLIGNPKDQKRGLDLFGAMDKAAA